MNGSLLNRLFTTFRAGAPVATTLVATTFVATTLLGCNGGRATRSDPATSNVVNAAQPVVLSPSTTLLANPARQRLTQKPQPENPNRPGVPADAPPGPAPDGMVWVPGGETVIGSDDGPPAEQPTFRVAVRGFWLDEHPVTVAEFGRFVRATGYQTQAETFGDGGTFSEQTRGWTLTRGACWHHPQGPGAPAAPANHPVTQVSWTDADAYARWAGKRLPTELEWEHAARNARNSRTRYPWGNALTRQGRALANTWNGPFPQHNANTDGFRTTSPVGYFGKTPLGLTDMAGNVWQWCANWRFSYADVAQGLPGGGQERAMRGGSFLCEPGWCHGYRVSGRSFSTPETALMHVGFRCAKDP